MSGNKKEVLRILRGQEGGYVSGQRLCEQLHVSRTAVWKYISQLKEEGYSIDSVPNKGYALVNAPDVLSEWEITSRMQTKSFGRRVVCYEETDSTNLRIKQMAEEGAEEGLLAVAECQSAGRGRRGRSWCSEPGSGIWMTLLLRPKCEPVCAAPLTLVAALAAVSALKETTGLDVKIKWPNDIVLNGKKICGILTEMSSEVDYINYVAVGIGINVNTRSFPEEVKEVATSLFMESGRSCARSVIIAAIMRYMEEYYEQFLMTKDFSKMQEAYNRQLVNKDRQVTVLAGEAGRQHVLYRGTAEGINKNGALLVRTDDGAVQEVVAGEVSVRGVYGYV